MIETMERKHRKWLALVILLSLVTVLIAVTVLPVWSANRHYQHQIVELEGQLEQKGRAAALGTRLQAQYDRLKRSQAAITHTLKSNSPALAGAELQGIVKRIAAAKNADVLSIQILPASEEQNFVRVTLKVRMRSALENIVQTFYALETGQPLLFLDNVSIQNNIRQVTRAASRNSILDANFEVTGYIPKRS
jgi:general secretion pathway protein M